MQEKLNTYNRFFFIVNQKNILGFALNVCQGANYLADASSLDLDDTVRSQRTACGVNVGD